MNFAEPMQPIQQTYYKPQKSALSTPFPELVECALIQKLPYGFCGRPSTDAPAHLNPLQDYNVRFRSPRRRSLCLVTPMQTVTANKLTGEKLRDRGCDATAREWNRETPTRGSVQEISQHRITNGMIHCCNRIFRMY